MTIDPSKVYLATLETEKGDIVIELYADKVPNTVNNFVFLPGRDSTMARPSIGSAPGTGRRPYRHRTRWTRL